MAMPIPPHLPNCFGFAGSLSLHSRSLACSRDERSHADQNRRSASQFIFVPHGLAKQTWIRTGCSFASPQWRDYCLQICISPPHSLDRALSTVLSSPHSFHHTLSIALSPHCPLSTADLHSATTIPHKQLLSTSCSPQSPITTRMVACRRGCAGRFDASLLPLPSISSAIHTRTSRHVQPHHVQPHHGHAPLNALLSLPSTAARPTPPESTTPDAANRSWP
ncbi:hypothetical protein BC831DRAFT_449684 [Entophlyctis helioformis]|nr:hypothetical protein BC831DRAFT_449684 [Entophlyctis helioformis]